ncbi:MAG TPA: xanthine dehydrogenase family protein subunit M [Oscillatoriaceae cyanobacterium]
MQPFAYARAASREGAVAAIAGRPGAVFLAGGTSLVDLMQLGVLRPEAVVDLNGLPEASIRVGPEGAWLGALARNSDVAAHAELRAAYPLLAEALLAGASPQLRHMATVGGNLMQRVRCPYYRDTAFACNRREPGTGCAAIGGCRRGHAVLGTSPHCIATHPSDMAVALAALEAEVEVQGPHGDRRVSFEDFYRLPGDTPHRATTLAPDELITGVWLPPLPFARRSGYLKVRDRASFDFALASAAAAVDWRDGVIHDVRLALGGVATRPWRAHAAERVLLGQPASPALFLRAADAELAAARPFEANAFKVPLARRTIARLLERLCGLGDAS